MIIIIIKINVFKFEMAKDLEKNIVARSLHAKAAASKLIPPTWSLKLACCLLAMINPISGDIFKHPHERHHYN